MKGIERINMKMVLAELKQIRKMQQQNNTADLVFMTLLDDGTVDVRATFKQGKKKHSVKNKNIENILDLYQAFPDIKENTPVIFDNMILECCDMYLPLDIICHQRKEVIKAFIDLSIAEDEIGYMELYLDLCSFLFEQEDEKTNAYIASEPVLMDIHKNYKALSVEELIERYKDQRFFTPQI